MKQLTRLSQRLIGTPLLVEQRKLDAVLCVLGPRLGIEAPVVTAGPHMEAKDRKEYMVDGGIAVIDISGSLVNRMDADALSGMTNYEEIGDEILDAATDPGIAAIVLRFDSFGGEVSGCFDLASLISEARKQKAVYAAVDDYAFSAAYLLASACEKIFVTQTAGVGSIGVRAMHVDYSQWNENMGIKPTCIFAGSHKNDLSPDEPLTDSARSQLQAEVDRIYEMFVQTVAKARGMSAESIRATEAALFYGADAVRAGLADEVLTFRGVMARLNTAVDPMPTQSAPLTRSRMENPAEITKLQQEASAMSEQTQTPVPAATPPAPQIDALAIADLCAIAGMDHRLGEFLRAKLTVDQVREKLLEARASVSDSAAITSNHAALAQTINGAISGAVSRIAAANPSMTPQQAYVKAMSENPALYDQYLAANPTPKGGN